MLGRALPVLTFAALAQARAIVSNHCPYPVYVWSVPQVLSSSHTDNVSLKPRGQYQEPWRHGSSMNPGVAIKVSTKFDGINYSADEIDFAYVVDGSKDNYVWVDLSPVRGDAFKDNLAFHSCHGQFGSANVQTQKCDVTDDVELVLCDTSPRASPAKDPSTLEKIKSCYDYHIFDPTKHADTVEAHAANQGHADEDTDTGSDSDTDCELRKAQSIKLTYTMAMTAEFSDEATAEHKSKSTAKSVTEYILPSADDPSSVPSTPSTSRVGFFTPPPPAPRETGCPECEKPRALSPCLAQVIYPARRRVPASPRNTPDATLPVRQANTSLCDIVRRYHTDVDDCDETALESYARELYPKVCDPVYASLLMGFPCEEIMKEMKSVYPAIDAPKISRSTTCECDPDCNFCGHFNDSCFCAAATALPMQESAQPLPTNFGSFAVETHTEQICLHSLCDPEIPAMDCQEVKNLLSAVLLLFDEHYEDWVSDIPGSCQPVKVYRFPSGQQAICLAGLCDLHPGYCDDIHDLLTSAIRAKFWMNMFFIKDHETCNVLSEQQL
jgi:hypothetical protein